MEKLKLSFVLAAGDPNTKCMEIKQKLLLCATALLRLRDLKDLLDSGSVFTRKVDCSDARFSEDRIGSDVR